MGVYTDLAEKVLADCKALDSWAGSATRDGPAQLVGEEFDKATLVDLPADVQAIQGRIVDSAATLRALVQDPEELLRESAYGFSTVFALQVINRYQLAQHVPLTGDVLITTVAQNAGIPSFLARRVFQLASTKHIFRQTRPDTVRHTAASSALRTSPGLGDEIGLLTNEINPSFTRTLDAKDAYGQDFGVEPTKTGFSIAHDTKDPMYIEIGKEPERARRFGSAMRHMTSGTAYDLSHLVTGNGDLWTSLAARNALLVDVGGGHGAVSCALAKAYPGLRCVVQDLPGTAKAGAEMLPALLKDKVSFEAHDFFTPQAPQDADVYLLRWILHNWSDKYCVDIIRALVPALKSGDRVVICEYVLPELPLPGDIQDWYKRTSDLVMLATFNGAERSEPQFVELFKQADSRFNVVRTVNNPGSALASMEFEFVG